MQKNLAKKGQKGQIENPNVLGIIKTISKASENIKPHHLLKHLMQIFSWET